MQASSGPNAARWRLRAHGTDRVETGSDGAIWIVCAEPKGWTARRGREHTSSEYPGTAVAWETDLFEVVEAVARADGSIGYRLEPWPDRHAVRTIQTYDEGSEAGRKAARRELGKKVRRRRISILLSPLLGHLPGAVQETMESEFGAPAVAMTIVSALPLFALGLVSFLFSLAAAYGAGYSAAGVSGLESASSSIPHLLPLALAAYLAVESGIRLGAAFLQARPVGSVAGSLLYEIWRIARGLPPPALGTHGRAATPRQLLEDRFRMLEAVLSLLSVEEQEKLERRFGMETLRWGRITALFLFAAGGLNVIASVAKLAAGVGGFGDFLWLLSGAAISVEQAVRLREIARGHPAGSVLGALIRPLAAPLLQERADPPAQEREGRTTEAARPE